MLFKIDFNDGTVLDFEGYESLAHAKARAGEIAHREFTDSDITIIAIENGIESIVANARWFGYPPEEEDCVWFEFAGGFYELWDDELDELWQEQFIM